MKCKRIFIFVIGLFLVGTLEVYADNNNIIEAYLFNTTTCKTGEETTCVKTTCYKDNTCEPGTIIKYAVNTNEIKYFYVLHDDKSTMTLQQRENTVSSIAWHETPLNPDNTKGPDTALEALKNATSSWTNIKEPTRLITYHEAIAAGCNEIECPEWMYTNLASAQNGYWTNDKSSDDNLTAFAIISGSIARANANTTHNGVRAVIIVDRKIPSNNNNNGNNNSGSNDSINGDNNNDTSNNNSNKGTTVVKVGNTAKTATVAGYVLGIFLLTLGIYVIYESMKRKNRDA